MAATWRFSDSPGRLEAADDPVRFQYHRLASALLDVITIAGEDGEPELGKVLAEIVSVVPALPPGATLTVSSSIPAVSALITFEAARASVLQGADVPVIGIDWQAQRGQSGGTVFAFADVPAGWRVVFGESTRADCLAYVEESWTDIRPKSLRDAMAADER